MTPSVIMLREIELAPDWFVVAYLKERHASIINRDYVGSREEISTIDQTILSKESPFLDLQLAKFCASSDAAKSLLDRNEPALKMAILQNRAIGREASRFPFGMFNDEDKYTEFLTKLTHDELTALIENDSCDEYELSEFIIDGPVWDSFNDQTREAILLAIHRRFQQIDLYKKDQNYRQPFLTFDPRFRKSLWKLAERLDATEDWAKLLSLLYMHDIRAEYKDFQDPNLICQKWEKHAPFHSELVGIGEINLITKLAEHLYANDYQNRSVRKKLLENDDIRYRLAGYKVLDLNKTDIRKAVKKDPLWAIEYISKNPHIWEWGRQKELRYLWKLSKDHAEENTIKMAADALEYPIHPSRYMGDDWEGTPWHQKNKNIWLILLSAVVLGFLLRN